MALIPLSLSTSSNPARYRMEGSARLINAYAEQTGSDAKAPWTIYATSGLDLWASVANSGTASGPTGVRAFLATDDYLYVVAGRSVTAIDVAGAQTLVTTLPGDGDVYMASNRRSPTPEVALVADGVAYIITGTSIVTVTDADLPPPISVSVIDGYFILPTTFDRVWISGEDNGTAYDPLDFGRAQKQPDNTLLVLGSERDAVIFGERTVEWWSNSPDETGAFPFVPIANINLGCASAKSVVQLDRAVAWYASDGTVRLMDGYSGRRISTHAVERALSGATGIQAYGWNEPDTGHAWLTWTWDAGTWSYNLRTDRWIERKSHKRVNWRGCQAVRWQGKTLIGDYTDGRIYELRADLYAEGGEPLIMEAIFPVVHSAPNALVANAIYIDAVTGVGTVVEPNPSLMVSTSNDGGRSFGAERLVSLGAAGDTLRRLKTYRLGLFGPQGMTLRIACSASVARSISGVFLEAEQAAA